MVILGLETGRNVRRGPQSNKISDRANLHKLAAILNFFTHADDESL